MNDIERYCAMFFVELGNWVDGGCAPDDLFDRQTAVCQHLIRWIIDKENGDSRHYDKPVNEALPMLNAWLDEHMGPNRAFATPFNVAEDGYSDMGAYYLEKRSARVYENAARLKFIRWARQKVLTEMQVPGTMQPST